jgi:hypothetical protein
MKCVHMHRRIPTIERWGSPNHIQSAMEKTREDIWKVGKTSRTVNQKPTLWPKHDQIQAWWISNILLKSMLEKVWWCKQSEMESWNQTICCSMTCLNERKHVWIGAVENHMPFWDVARKERWCCRFMPRAQKGKEDDQQYI